MLFFFSTLVRRRAFIIQGTLIFAILTAAISFVLPRWYTASTSIFPPESQSSLSMYAGLISGISLPFAGNLASGVAPETININMLKSRRVGEKLVSEFDLQHRYKTGTMEKTLDALHSHMGFTLLENGLLVVTLEDKNPEVAAHMLNRAVELLDDLNREINVTRASRMRVFLEKQVKQRKADLSAAEDSFNVFQKKNQALEMDEQLRSALDIVGSLTADAISLENELDVLGQYASKSSDEYVSKKRQYDEVVAQLRRLKMGGPDGKKRNDADMVRAFVPALADVPDLALEFMRHKRDVKIESTVYAMLVKEYEKARMDEARDVSTVQVLDPAEVPAVRSRPRRKLLVIAGALAGFAWSAMIALILAAWNDNRDRSPVIRDVLGPLIGDFSRLLRRGQR